MPIKKIKAVKKVAKRAYDVLRDGDEQAKKNYREIIKDAKDSGFPYSKKEKEEIRRFGSTKAEIKAESDTARKEISESVKDMGGFFKGGLASAAKTIAGKTTRSRNKTKPRGVGVATRGFGKALK